MPRELGPDPMRSTIVAITAVMLTVSTGADAAGGFKRFERVYASPQVITTPDVGEEAEVEVGQTMLAVEPLELLPAIRLKTKVTGKSSFRIVVSPGVLPLKGRSADGDFYQQEPRAELYTFGLAQPDANGGVFIPSGGGNPQLYWEADPSKALMVDTQGVEFERTTARQKSDRPLRRELVYSGVSKGVVQILYREFLGDLARPAFSQELTYDLTDGDELGYRGARLKVIKATNTSIRFKVMRPLDPSR